MGLKQAGQHLIKANFGAAFSELIKPSEYRNGQSVSRPAPVEVIQFGGDGVGAFYAYDGVGSCLTAYEQCPPLQAVCNRRALALINGIPTITNSLGKPSSSFQSKRVLKLLANPNPLQTQSAFLAQISTYIDIIGYAVVIPLRPVGFEMYESDSLWVVPPTLVSFMNNGNELNFTTGGIDAVQIGATWIKPEDVMIITDINPSVKKMVLPGAKIKSLELPINNIIGAYESESTMILHRGPTGFISNEISTTLGAPSLLLDDEKIRLQNEFNMAYGLKRGQSHIILTNAALKYQKTGFDITELGLHDTIINSTKSICDTIGYPTPLMGILDSKYDNMEQADKQLYTKFIIPHAKNIAEQLGSYLLPLTDKLCFEYDHVPELQKDKIKEATARKTLGEALEREFRLNMITYNRMLVLLGEEPREGFDRYYYELKGEIDFVFGNSNNNQQQQDPNQTNDNNQKQLSAA